MDAIVGKAYRRKLDKDNIIQIIKVSDWLYILDEVNTTHMYLIKGSEKALLFDAGFGFTDLKKAVSGITDLPVTVVCSHGHDDHVLGCCWFDSAYIAEEDIALCLGNDNDIQRGKQIDARKQSDPEVEELVDRNAYYSTSLKGCRFDYVRDGDEFDLGGLKLMVCAIPGHTKGSIGLYCREKKALFSGDTIMKNHVLVYAQSLDISAAPQDFIHALSRLMELDIESVWPAHGDAPAEPEVIADTRAMLIDWADHADPDNEKSIVPQSSVFAKPGSFAYKYSYKGMTLNYNPGHLDQIREFMEANGGRYE